MKTKNLIERLSLFLLALVLTMPTWAQGGSGNESETITIASKEDWKAFCDRVNSGQTTLNAKLTKDVDLGEEIVMAGTKDLYSPGYNNYFYYTGTFDGQGHTLSFSWDAGSRDDIAPFKYVKDATIKNLRTQGKITTKGDGLSGMVYAAFGTTTLTGCISDVDITGGNGGWYVSQAAGMVKAVVSGASVQITDCLVKGSITDNADESERGMAGFVLSNIGTYTLTRCLYVGKNNATNNGYSNTFGAENGISATFTDCYYLNTCGKAQGTQVTAERLKSGEMAKLLQGDRTENVWGQTLGTDNEPLPTTDATKRVYEVKFTYNGEVKATRYANSGKTVELPTAEELLGTGYNPKMTYMLNFGDFTANTPVTEDKSVDVTVTGTFDIASKEDWKAFCDLVNSGQTKLNAKLTKDVDLGEEIVMVGEEFKMYEGTFDGQGHTLTVNWNSALFSFPLAPFAYVENATIKNLHVKGHITGKEQLAGLIYTVHGNTTLSNCVSEVDIKGESYLSGMIYRAENIAKVTFTDCVVKGALNSDATNNMAGFVYQMWGDCTFNNCLYLGTNNATAGNTFAGNNTEVKNCYYLNACGRVQGTQVTEEQLKNGAVAYKLQNGRSENVWGQKLGTDNEPQLTAEAAKHVYEVKFTLNNEVKATRYANGGGSVATLPTAQDLLGTGYNPHHYYAIAFEGGFNASTTVNADRKVDITLAEKDCYEIASKADWQAFCALVEDGQNAVDAKMTQDVDLGSDIVMAGTYDNKYSGTFDGQNHTLKINWNSSSSLAPFQYVKSATIRNLRTEGYIKSITYGLSGLIYSVDGATTISGCVSAVNITSSYNEGGCAAAGMIERVSDNAKVTITDCVVKGKFTATTEEGKRYMAGFVCNQYGTCTLTNCLYVGENNGTGSNNHTFGYKTTLTNCYYLNACGEAQGERIVEKQLKSGEVTKKLQGDRTDSCHWAQVLGEMPNLYHAPDKSRTNYVYYDAANSRWTCEDFRLTDGTPLPIGLDFTATKATYDRTLAAGKATLCLPYELPVQGFKAYTLSENQGNPAAVHFEKVSGTLGAYRPYLLVADGTPQLGGENLQVKADCSSLVLSAGNYYFKGAVHDVVNWWLTSDHAYILQADGLFHKVTSDNPSVTVPAYRAYISYNSHEGAKRLSIVFDGETTGIGGTTNGATDGAADGAVYNLQGQRVADRLDDSVRRQIPTGVYIVNGRKVIVK